MRVRGLLMSVAFGMPVAMAASMAVLMMAERHALPAHHRRHALQRHNECDGAGNQAKGAQRHGFHLNPTGWSSPSGHGSLRRAASSDLGERRVDLLPRAQYPGD